MTGEATGTAAPGRIVPAGRTGNGVDRPAAGGTPVRVARYDHASQLAGIEEAVLTETRRCLRDGTYILSGYVDRFEQAFADYLGVRHAIGVNSGTDALVLALAALGVGPGDEVVTVANTFHATALSIVRVGARPVLVDCRREDYLLDTERLGAAVTPRTKAIVVVHLFGKVVPLTPVLRLAEEHGIPVVEDCCQAVGARWQGRRVGGLGAIGCYSFHPSKNLAAAGDAGAVVTDDPALAGRVRRLRNFGQERQNDHLELAWNTKLDALQAIVLFHKLARLDGWNAARVRIAGAYRRQLASAPVGFQAVDGSENVYHLFQVETPARDALHRHLLEAGVDAVVRYPVPLHLQAPFAQLGYSCGDFPAAEAQAAHTLCLPIRPDLSEADVRYVCRAVAEFFDAEGVDRR